MANTALRIKRSLTTGVPGSLQSGELAYSYQSNTIFIGSPDGTGVVNVGGQYYTSQIDSATSANGSGTLVRRDASGNAAFNYISATNLSGTLAGVANAATQFETDRYINVTGGDITASAQLFNGTANATLSASLNAVAGLTAGVYGGSTTVPIVTVAANGRIMSIANSATISTVLGIAGDSGTDSVSLATDTLTFAGGAGLTSTVTDNTITLDVDNTVVRANTASLNQIIDGNVQISGNLSVLGSSTVVNTTVLEVSDPLIYLAGNNYVSDIVDIGFVGNYNTGAANVHAGFIRHAGTKEFYAFDSYNVEPNNNVIDITGNGFNTANLVLNVAKANVIGNYVVTTKVSAATGDLSVGPAAHLTTFKSSGVIEPAGPLQGGNYGGNQIDVTSIGFGTQIKGVYEGVDIVVSSDGTGANVSKFLANGTVTFPGKILADGVDLKSYIDGAYATGNAAVTSASALTTGAIVIGAGGNTVSSLANSTYTLTGSLSASKTITSLTVDAYGRVTAATAADISGLTVAQGGTGASTFSNGGLLVGSGTGAIGVLANSTYTLTGTLGAAKTISSLTVDAYGRVTAATATDISGLTVAQGGTGASTFTAQGIVYGDGTNAMAVTSAAGTADQTWSNQILTTTNAGVPVWTTTLDGGQF